MSKREVVLVAVACIGLGVAACGSSTPSAAGHGTTTSTPNSTVPSTTTPVTTTTPGAVSGLDVCSLVSPAAASAALQETATLVPSTSKTTCSYSGSLGTTLTVTVVSTTMTPATFSKDWGTSAGAIAGTKAVEAWSANQLIMEVLAGHDLITIQASQDLLGQGGYMVNFETLAQTIVGLL